MKKPLMLGLSVLLATVFVVACASIDVKRVKADDYETEGFRFYLPRPYVVVKKSFPVGGESVFVSGKLDGDRITEIDTSNLPEPIARFLGSVKNKASVPVGQVTMFVTSAAPAADLASSTPAGAVEHTADSAAADNKPTPISPALWLSKSKVAPETLQSSDNVFLVTLLFSAENGFDSIDDAGLEVGVVPLGSDGVPDLDNFAACAKTASPKFEKAKELTYTASGLRKDLKGGPFFRVATRFKGAMISTSGDKKQYLAVAPNVGLTAVGATPAPAKKEGGSEKKVEAKSPTSAKASLSGDPSTPVVNPVNEYFDLMYLPDFTEQYAVKVKTGIGEATLDLGLENGWLVEKASVSASNKELGNFLFQQIDRFTSIASDAIRIHNGLLPKPADSGAVEQAAEERVVGAKKEKWVVLKVTYSLEALPGVYPVLKPNETCNVAGKNPTYVHIPSGPFTVVAFNVRHDTVIELVTTNRSPADPPADPPRALGAAETGKVVDGIKAHANTLTGTIKDALLQVAERVTMVTMVTKVIAADVTPVTSLSIRTSGVEQDNLAAAKSHIAEEKNSSALSNAIRDKGVACTVITLVQD